MMTSDLTQQSKLPVDFLLVYDKGELCVDEPVDFLLIYNKGIRFLWCYFVFYEDVILWLVCLFCCLYFASGCCWDMV